MKVTKIKIDELKTPERNVRIHNERQLNEYIRSIKMFGQIRPIVCDENKIILAGNGLYLALKQMGVDDADCYVVEGLDQKQKDKLMLADNKVFDLGITDTDTFKEIVKSLDGDIDIPGYDEDLLKTLTMSFNHNIEQANEELQSYGQFDVPEQYHANSQENLANGGAVKEEMVTPSSPNVVAGEPMAKAESKKFIICPCCGAKIEL